MNKASKIYNIQLSAALVAYTLVLVVSIWFIKANPESIWRIPAALAPMIPAASIPFVVMRYLRNIDELQRQIQLEALGFAFGGTAILTFAYGFLQGVGFPQASWFWIWPIMAVLWGLGTALATRRYR